MKKIIPLYLLILIADLSLAQKIEVVNLRTELINNTESQYKNTINTRCPHFSWSIETDIPNFVQKSYRIIVSSSEDAGYGDMWDSGNVSSSESCGIIYEGNSLEANKSYYWKVMVSGEKKAKSQYSEAKEFCTAGTFDESVSYMRLVTEIQNPVEVFENANSFFADFGKDAFGQIALRYNSASADNLTIHLGEVRNLNNVNRNPGGSRRYRIIRGTMQSNTGYTKPIIPADAQNTNLTHNGNGITPIFMPSYIGEVTPFRYAEIEGASQKLGKVNIERVVVNYPWDDEESYFESSDEVLNQVYDLCKYSMKATSFCGYFVDGDRERIPYEADMYINMLTYYSVSSNYTISRRTIEHIINYPTWPTEWILYTNLMVYLDYLYTGDNSLIINYYEDLKNKTLNYLRNSSNGLLHTGNKIKGREDLRRIHFKGPEVRNIVDWPHRSANEPGEDDSYDYKECNTVVNHFYYKNLELMAKMASVTGKSEDAHEFSRLASQTRKSINSLLLKNNVYTDGLGSSHTSLHAQMFGLALDVAEKAHYSDIVNLIKSKGMVCSVYGAQFFLDAIYNAGQGDYALGILTSKELRSFYNMIKIGSTITTEAWDNSLKPNQDWNHAWGSAAGNVIVRKLMGIEPLEPGFARFSVKPQPGNLKYAKVKVPTLKGPIEMSFTNDAVFKMSINVPANTEAVVTLPDSSDEIILHSGTHIL